VVALYFTFIGGQIAVLVTDFLQSVFCNVVLLVLLALLLIKFPLTDVFEGLKISEPGKSMLSPFDAGEVDFDPFFFLIGYVGIIFNRIGVASSAYYCSAKTPHDQKMAGILGGFRAFGLMCTSSAKVRQSFL
jgi:SSS family solute:Na+ symporter